MSRPVPLQDEGQKELSRTGVVVAARLVDLFIPAAPGTVTRWILGKEDQQRVVLLQKLVGLHGR
jgi:hypothetical protein